MWPWGSGRDAFLLSVSCSGHPGAPGSVWLCLQPAKLEPVEVLHGVAGVPSAHGAGGRVVEEPLVKMTTSDLVPLQHEKLFSQEIVAGSVWAWGRTGERNSRLLEYVW